MTTIDEIEALLARATPLPWRAGQWHPNTIAADGGWPVDTSCSGMEGGGCERTEDRDLIIALRNAAPDLIAVVRAAAKVATPNGMHLTTEAWGALEEALAKLGVRP